MGKSHDRAARAIAKKVGGRYAPATSPDVKGKRARVGHRTGLTPLYWAHPIRLDVKMPLLAGGSTNRGIGGRLCSFWVGCVGLPSLAMS